jgi:hypothetical protein
MNNKLFPVIGVVALIALVGVSLALKQNSRGSNPVSSLFGKKEIMVGTDICGEFPGSWVQNAIGKPIVKSKPFSMKGTWTCSYFIDETEFAAIKVNELNVETQKKGQEMFGRSIKTDPRIPMEHFISWQGDGLINSIFLVLTPDKFVSIDRSSTTVYDNEGEIAFAVKVAERIQKRQNVTTSTATSTVAPTSGPAKASSSGVTSQQAVVDNFLKAISEGKPSDAVMMMTSAVTGNDASKQAFAVQFAMKGDWTDTFQEYQITVDVEIKPGVAVDSPIPDYGWENGSNVRFIILEKVGSDWKIQGIATGP